jgi:hypothetical protein
MICRAEDATAWVGARENMAAGIDRQRSDIGRDYALINLDPTISVVRRTVNAAGTADKISSCEDVTTAGSGH